MLKILSIQMASVAKEIWNRKMSGNPKRYARNGKTLTWKNILFKSYAYDVATGAESHCKNARDRFKFCVNVKN